MVTHPNVLAWRIPGMGEPGVLRFMGSQRGRRLSNWTELKWLRDTPPVRAFGQLGKGSRAPAGRLAFKAQSSSFLAGGPWASCLASLGSSFLLCVTRMVTVIPYRVVMRLRVVNARFTCPSESAVDRCQDPDRYQTWSVHKSLVYGGGALGRTCVLPLMYFKSL